MDRRISENKTRINIHPKIEHIGSTSIQSLSAKPIIDILIGVNKNSELDLTIDPMIQNKFIYYKVYDKDMPKRRFYVGLKFKKIQCNVF